MKKRVVLVLLALLVIPIAFAETKWTYSFTPKCGICVEGQRVNATLYVFNDGDEPLEISSLRITDAHGISFIEGYPKSTVPVEEFTQFEIPLNIPPATRGSTLYYYVCLGLPGGEECSDLFSRFMILPLTELDCYGDDDCAEDETCNNLKCKRLFCEHGLSEPHVCAETAVGQNAFPYYIAAGFFLIILIILIVWVMQRRKSSLLNL